MKQWFVLADAASGSQAEAVAAAPAGDSAAVATTATEAAPGDGADAAGDAPQPQGGSPWGGFMMPLLLIALFYFMFLKPQQRKEKERRKMIDELRSGARIVFAGGIIGTIVEASEKTFVVETRDGSRMEVLRSCVQALASDGAEASASK